MAYIKNFLGADLPCIEIDQIVFPNPFVIAGGPQSVTVDFLVTGAPITGVVVDTQSVIFFAPQVAAGGPTSWTTTPALVTASIGTYTVTIEATDANGNVAEFTFEAGVI